ncbi:MAG: hypothetical protein MUP85_22100, partial [Candidatus Lokiarchaeota archaeon]|nr:hypothetical protein [Candidatus Lokiarchaeota archaeon]
MSSNNEQPVNSKAKIRFYEKKGFNALFTFLGFVVSIFIIIWQCKQEEKIDELNFKTSSIQYRPIIRFVGNPWVKNFSFDGKKLTESIFNPKE